jgi:hypothetical protein
MALPKMKKFVSSWERIGGFPHVFKARIILERHLYFTIRFFIGYWILKRGWIFILALFLCFALKSANLIIIGIIDLQVQCDLHSF